MRLQTAVASSTAQLERIRATCLPTDDVGDCVYISGPNDGQLYQVSRVDISDPAKMPMVGVLVSKTGATSCVVQMSGIVKGVYVGLTPGDRLLVQDNGRPGHGQSRATTGVKIIQCVGVALSENDITIQLQKPVVTLAL